MQLNFIFAALLCFTLYASSIHAETETINLSAAASMTDVFNELTARFLALHPGVKVQGNYGSSGSLAKQIEQGAPADIYVAANPGWMEYLARKQLIESGTDRIFACNFLVFVSREINAGAVDMAALTKLERIAIGTPQSVPAGQYAKQAMEHTGVYGPLDEAGKLIMAKDVRQALLYAELGEVDGAFVYKTDWLATKNAHIVFVVPAELHERISYPLALTARGGKKRSARAFYTFIRSPDAVAVLEKYGFQPAR